MTTLQPDGGSGAWAVRWLEPLPPRRPAATWRLAWTEVVSRVRRARQEPRPPGAGSPLSVTLQVVTVMVMSVVAGGCLGGAAGDSALGGVAAGPPDGGRQDPQPPDRGLANACDQLVRRTCGEPGMDGRPPCEDDPACVAANLVAAHDREACADRLDQPERYPACRGEGLFSAPACQDLLARCCGGDLGDGGTQCGTRQGCVNARAVAEGADNAACSEAMGDPGAFPRCSGSGT